MTSTATGSKTAPTATKSPTKRAQNTFATTSNGGTPTPDPSVGAEIITLEGDNMRLTH